MVEMNKYPSIDVPGDKRDSIHSFNKIMARSPQLMGATKSRRLWRFGFLRGSAMGRAFGVHVENSFFIWILASDKGTVIERWEGPALNMPRRFRQIIDKEW